MTPLSFLTWLRAELRKADIHFALTSGQACVYYGIQQTTKDSDWIIAIEDISKLRGMLTGWDTGGNWRAEYRSICGAPLDRVYHEHGWTSHLTITQHSTQAEQRVDLFGKPPRVQRLETDPADADIASRHTVAQMKKTDRDKDWPIVFSIGRQMLEQGDWRGVLHIQDSDSLTGTWPKIPDEFRSELTHQRPLLAMIENSPRRLRRAIAIERSIWVAVNQVRYGCYQRAWKEFYRRWRREPGMLWPLAVPFSQQHEVLLAACRTHALPVNPFDETDRRQALTQALSEAAEIMAATSAELKEVVPPPEVLLP